MWINGDKWQIKDEYVQGISTKVHEINKYIAEQQEDGYFIFPFFVRYAYRLYDGSVIMQSAPVLMLLNDSGAPVVVSKIERLSQVIFTGISVIYPHSAHGFHTHVPTMTRRRYRSGGYYKGGIFLYPPNSIHFIRTVK